MAVKVRDIIAALEQEFPLCMAMDWDNPGLQVGRLDREVHKVVIALDATDAVIARCVEEKADMLLTHHPLLMSEVRQINESGMAGRRILTLIENGIAHYAMHTNYDTAKMGELAADRLGLKDRVILEETGADENGAYGIGFAGTLPEKMTAGECCRQVVKAFELEHIRLFGDPKTEVQYIAISPGSGKSMVKPALSRKVDLLITGDIGHHDGIDAVDQGMLVADAGHYGIEHIFIGHMEWWMQQKYAQTEVIAVWDNAPFTVI